MLSKLAIGNVKKSFRDYSVYFLTLMFGVCIFYVFNSIESQQAMLDISESQAKLMQAGITLMGILSFFVAVILGFLILYANKFLIKRRSKELGVYMTLGMDRKRISLLLMLETLIVGLLSLAIGLALGFLISQGFSSLTALILGVQIKNFSVTFSVEALVKSIVCFAVIFGVAMLFNAVTVSRCRLIDLIRSRRSNESPKMRRLWVVVLAFVLSVALLGTAYAMILHNGMIEMNLEFWGSIAIGFVGTILFFFSLSNMLVRLVKACKGIYYKGLNMFVLRQLGSKINTNFLSISMVCLMLLVAVGTLSSGLGVGNVFTTDVESFSPYDASVWTTNREKEESILANLESRGFDLGTIGKYVETVYYQDGTTYERLMQGELDAIKNQFMLNSIRTSPIDFMTLSDFNKQMELIGQPALMLADDEYLIDCDIEGATKIFSYYQEHVGELEIQGKRYRPRQAEVLTYALSSNMGANSTAVIVPDDVAQGLTPSGYSLNIMYTHGEESERLFNQELNSGAYKGNMFVTRQQVYEQGYGLKLTVVYLMMYVGIVFLITSAAVLALQQMSDASDNRYRYELLRRLGASPSAINRALFKQILMYFLLPLVLAVCHAAVGLTTVGNVLTQLGHADMMGSIAICAGVMGVLYVAYFLATYLSAKSMIRKKR